MPFKRARSGPLEYLEFDEIQAVLTAIDRSTADGRRDHVFLATMFNTGARVQEINTLRVLDVHLQTPAARSLVWKGTQGTCLPIVAAQTAEIFHALLAERGDSPLPEDPLFRNHRGFRLTRFGVRYILQKILHSELKR